MKSYYNEIDPFAAAWLRQLIAEGRIAYGVVDERSIEDVRPSDLEGFTQCHFFAGIGVWSYALRQSGWPDDRPVWTASCPCQPFSAAGTGGGFDDERHLWPAFYHLVEQCRPATIIGEQVASKATGPWFDLVQADVEALGYAFGCVPFPSAGVGAPHIRDRAYWVADTDKLRQPGPRQLRQSGYSAPGGDREVDRIVDAGGGCGLEHPEHEHERPALHVSTGGGYAPRPGEVDDAPQDEGFWGGADWLGCRDGKWRPVEPGTFPLVNGPPARVGRLRGYGNAINAEAAKAFIESVSEAL